MKFNESPTFFYTAAAAVILLLCGCKTSHPISFYVFSDTHCIEGDTRFNVLDTMIGEANTLYMKSFPDTLQYMKNQKAKGVLVCGDLTDGAKAAQWQQFVTLFGLNGEGHLKIPLYENYGNHDGDTSGIVRMAIKERNTRRKNLTNISANGLHYSWDWGKYHFVSLGSYPSDKWDSTCNWCHYFKNSFREPQQSLSFLKEDLNKYANRKEKVVLYFHYGWDSFSKLWWTEDEQEKFYEVIKDYNVAAIFTGHNHATGFMKWKGINVYSAGSPQSDKRTGSFLYVSATKDSLHVIERRYDKWGNQSYAQYVN